MNPHLMAVACLVSTLLAACGDSSSPPSEGTQNPPPLASACPTSVDPARFASSDALWQHHVYLDSLKARPTGSPSHQAFVDWLDERLDEIPGLERREQRFTINRWLEREASLSAGPGPLDAIAVSSAIPYSQATDGVIAPLVYVPIGQAIADSDVAGKIIVREAATDSIPRAAFLALAWWLYDPEQSFLGATLDNYERDFLGYTQRMTDLREAGAGGAAGLILMHSFPRAQMLGHYAPYDGERWPVPGLYVGVDEGEQLKQIAAAGGSAHIRLLADEGPVETRTLIARLPGQSAERIAIESHTDGTNVHEDNGPLVILEMARYFASLPIACRPRTLEFAFATAHFHLQLFPPEREGGAGVYARELDFDYDSGDVAMALVLEHLGTLGYDAVPRTDGPGRVLVPNGRPEPYSMFVNDSPVLISTLLTTVITHDLRGAIALRGADLPGAHVPVHFSFGGEGGGYNLHLIPTVAYITSPWALYNPSFGLEVLDQDLIYRQTLMFTDFVHSVAPLSKYLLAGGVTAEREARSVACAAGNPASLFICEGTPAESEGAR